MDELKDFSFGQAIDFMKMGFKVSRKGWNGKGIYIALHKPEGEFMTQEFIYINTTGLITDNEDAPKNIVPWLASQTDMLAEDWCFYEKVPVAIYD